VRRLALVLSLGVVLSACAPDTAAAPTATGTFRIATLLTQTRTPAPTSVGSGALVVQSGTATVEVGDQFFIPPQIIATVGTTVLWINRGQLTHTATARDRSFGSGNMEFGNAFSYTFTRVGIYQYYCQLHGDMIGEVDVR
jgi:plastocyanin